MNHLVAVAPGFLTTVQDLGRPGYAHFGISASGAADALSLRAGNRLVGNPDRAAALEMTLVGGTFTFQRDTIVAVTGSDFGANVPMWEALEMKAGETLRCGPTRGGARCYLCVRGGLYLEPVLGSASTHLLTGIGGLHGRALKRGDVLDVGPSVPGRAGRRIAPPEAGGAIRVTRAPQADWFSGEFYRAAWQVTEESNRMGLRLRGPAIERHEGHMLTEGVSLGAIQVPPEGQPIILFVEHQTTGGYPKIANVISADLHRAGQLRPRDEVRFELVTVEQALALLRDQERWLAGIR